ncbi:MAG: IS630 family transposase [Oscillochloris sp.]|nr:IS630 family transposase [Oscillochloris sp.]
MPTKTYLVTLTDEERHDLRALITKGTLAARKLTRAHILLLADEGRTDATIAAALHVGTATIARIRKRFVEEGVEAALSERPRPGKAPVLDAKHEAYVIATACSAPPEGQARWSIRLLTDTVVQLGMVDAVSRETIRRTLKKTFLKPWQVEEWVLSEITAEFAYHMEDILELYAEPVDPQRPRVCVDERPVQLISEVRTVLPVAPGRPERHDYEYKREGTANLYMIACPDRAWRTVKVTDRRGTLDFAHVLKDLVDVHFPDAERIRLVMDNLNVHTLAVLYEVFDAPEARRIARKFEIHYTPKHGSWLNMAEIEFAVLASQCLDQRIPDQTILRRECGAWTTRRNDAQATIDWRFTADAARTKLERLYPS